MSEASANLGLMYYTTTDNNEINMYRVIKLMGNDKVIVRSENDPDITHVENMKDVRKNPKNTILKPDTIFSFFITKYPNIKDKDVLCTIYPIKYIESDKKYPYAVARQLVVNKLDMFSIDNNKIYGALVYGESEEAVRQKILFMNEKQTTVSHVIVSSYITDTPKDIMSIIPNVSELNKILRDNICNISKTENRTIQELQSSIALKSVSDYIISMISCVDIFNNIYDIQMDIKDFNAVEFAEELGVSITDVDIIEYYKDIDSSKIASCFFVRDTNYKIYIISCSIKQDV